MPPTKRATMYEYRPLGCHLNDFTLIRKSGLWHLFHIVGRTKKGNPALANEGKAVGHATTKDFIRWTEHPHIVQTHGACYAIKHKGRYALIGHINNICWSDDLFRWSATKPLQHANDPAQWYESKNLGEEARYVSRRDPFIVLNPENGKYVMFYCDRVKDGDVYNRGCVGALESDDLQTWTFCPPVFGPKHFYCESPHLVTWGGKYHLFFSLSPECAARHAVSEKLMGPYHEIGEGNILPFYHGAGDAIQHDGKWLYFGRVLEREERRRSGRLMPGCLSLPVELSFDDQDRCVFSPYSALKKLRKRLLLDGFAKGWSVRKGDWKLTSKTVRAQNLYTQAPAGAVLGSAYFDDARLDHDVCVGNFDMECTFQLPTFAWGSMHFRAGWILRGYLRLDVDAVLQTMILSDADGTVLCTAPLRDCQLDRYYDLRVIFLGDFIQVYLNNHLLMYLCVYGPSSGPVSLAVWQGDALFAKIKIYEMPSNGLIPVFANGNEPFRPELP